MQLRHYRFDRTIDGYMLAARRSGHMGRAIWPHAGEG